MPTRANIERNTIVRIAAYDNDEYSVSEIEENHSLKIYDNLGLGSERRKRCAKFLNRYIKDNKGTQLKNSDLVKKEDSVADVFFMITNKDKFKLENAFRKVSPS